MYKAIYIQLSAGTKTKGMAMEHGTYNIEQKKVGSGRRRLGGVNN
jgi:hypothetical protein